MRPSEQIILRRECEATRIPSGQKVMLPAGAQVRVTQSLGGTYTVMTNNGYLVRIANKDADALGQETPTASPVGASAAVEGPADVEQLVWDQLRTCFDPEIPVNIVDLGLVYHCQATPVPGGGNRVEVKFTLTAPGCGMGAVLQADIESKILSVPGVEDVDVEVVFDPPWNQDMMS
ncbi:MAG TPA: putative Fe-S cluster assembly protein SufT, partial [Candidatus Binatia bacterium]|nr:putative Fe-S cluster assembly protein SufT [Candidatus Binatia bacterium]